MRRFSTLLLVAAGCVAPAAAPVPAPALPPAPLDPSERVENPAFTRWAKAAPGDTAVYEDVTDVNGATRLTGSSVKLESRTEGAAEIRSETWETTRTGPDASHTNHSWQTLKQHRWMAKPAGAADDPGRPAGTYADGTKTITVRGKEYATRWYKAKGRVEAGETDTQTWYCDDVPGGLVRSVHRIPAIKKTVTTELVEVRRP